MRNIALYGGAFDPPHIGHIKLIRSLVDVKGIDEVWLMPCGDRNDKKLLLPKDKRFDILKILFKDQNRIKVSEDEIEISKRINGAVHTYDLLTQMKQKYKDHKFSLVIGGDVLHTIHRWGKAKELQQEYNFVIYNRKGYQLTEKLPLINQVIQTQLPEISSSFIKKTILDEQMPRQEKLDILKPWLEDRVLNVLLEEKVI